MKLWRHSRPILSSPLTARQLNFTAIIETVGFQGYHGSNKKVMRVGQLKIQSLLLLPKLSCFFFHTQPSVCCKPLVSFQISNKVDLEEFWQCFWFHVGAKFYDSTILEMIPICSFVLKLRVFHLLLKILFATFYLAM